MVTILLSCQTAPPKPETNAVEQQPDPDIVAFQGNGQGLQKGNVLGVKPMTFAELTDCATKVKILDKGSEDLKLELARLDQRKEQMAKQNIAMENERTKINPKDTKKVQAFNQRIEHLQAVNVQLNKDIDNYNDAAEAQSTLSNQHNLSCSNRVYRQSDELRLPRELQEAMVLHSKTSNLPVQEDASSETNPALRKAQEKIHIGN